MHTVYGGAHLFKPDTAVKLGRFAAGLFERHATTPSELAEAFGIELDEPAAERVHGRVRAALAVGAVADYRVDFEDGYGVRSGDEEDEHARAAGQAIAAGHTAGTLPPMIGFRVRPFGPASRTRAERTLNLVLEAMTEASPGGCPPGLIVTLPKAESMEEVAAFAAAVARAEATYGIERKSLRVELLIETPRSLVAPDGRWALPGLVAACEGRCLACHIGAYDYLSLCGVGSAEAVLHHPMVDWLRGAMRACLGQSNVNLADGATNHLPIEPHRATDGGSLTGAQLAENRAAVHASWHASVADVTRSLNMGFWQGWDLHPGQIPARLVAVHAYFQTHLDEAAARMRRFLEATARATRVGGAFDDAATAQTMLNYFRRGYACGALDDADLTRAGLSPAALEAARFDQIVSAD